MTQARHRGLRVVVQAAIVGGLMPIGAAAFAQSEPVGPPMSAEEIRICLCLGQEITELRRETELQESLRDDREAELNRVDQQIERSRATMDVGDPEAVQDLQRLVRRQQMLRDILRSDVGQAYRDSVERLNERVALYNDRCASRPMSKLEAERIQETLQCPAP